MKIADFRTDLKRGHEGEDYFLNVFNQFNNVEIIDVSDNPEYQECDIDFLLIKNGKKHCVEIKTDSYTSGNMFYEEMSCKETHSLGCFRKTCANILLYYFPKMGIVYAFYNMNKFKEWYENTKDKYRHCNIANKRNGGLYNAWGGLIPLVEFDKYNNTAKDEDKFVEKIYIKDGVKDALLRIVDLTTPYEVSECVKISNKVRIKPSFRNIR